MGRKHATEEERKEAKRLAQQKWYAKNREREMQRSRQWHIDNKEYHNAHCREKYQENRENILKRIQDKRLNETEDEKILRRERQKQCAYDPKNFISRTYSSIKCRERGKKEVKISKQDLEELLIASNGVCAISGFPLTLERNNLLLASVDRIDSSKGYIKGNVQFVAKCVNIAKSDLPQDEFIAMCKAVVDYNS